MSRWLTSGAIALSIALAATQTWAADGQVFICTTPKTTTLRLADGTVRSEVGGHRAIAVDFENATAGTISNPRSPCTHGDADILYCAWDQREFLQFFPDQRSFVWIVLRGGREEPFTTWIATGHCVERDQSQLG